MDWNQINSWGNLLEHLMPPTRTVENSWNCLLLKERRNKEAIRQSSKNQRGCWDQLDNKQTDLVLHARERQDKERRKKGEGVSKSKKGGWVWNQREPQMGARGWETRGDSDCRANKRTWEEREGLRGQRFSRRMKGCKQSPLSCFCKPSAASLLHLLQFCFTIALAPIASAQLLLGAIMQLFVRLQIGGRMMKGPNRIPRCNCYLRGEKMLTDFGRSAFILACAVRFQFTVRALYKVTCT